MTYTNKKVWTILEIINWGKNYLLHHGITNGKLELEWYLAAILKCSRIDLYLNFDQPLNNIELEKIRNFISRRKNKEPFQYILNKASFYGRDFLVSPHVLIPRPETETIIEISKKLNFKSSFIDIGTGSGCIAITLLKENIFKSGLAIDICEKTIEVAKENTTKLSVNNLTFKRIDFLTEIIDQKFDLIVSNPPYISIKELNSLQCEIFNHEPHIALTDSFDGLSFYKRFSDVGKNLLTKNGCMLLETGGVNQIKKVNEIFLNLDFTTNFHKDQNGEHRFIEVRSNS
ncbi:MAG: peptide chain release factor N(5)-glutamine methyltransferase [Candidatus Neomarinimicrobiota bacterium]|nr:peptide chain release factor N(5)-glutamine methyltransferase [Candidatus Neomarinimicrobiota bacterium]